MKNKLFRMSLVTVILFVMLFNPLVNFSLGVATYASEGIEFLKTNSENIYFQAYFKNNLQNVLSVSLGEETEITVQVKVIKNGYFNGKIVFENPNFEIVGCDSEFVESFSSNEVVLNKVNSFENVSLDIKIKPVVGNNFSSDVLSKTTNMNLVGEYFTTDENSIEINSKQEFVLKIESGVTEENVEFGYEVLTNKVIDNARVLQVRYDIGLNKSFPVKNIELDIQNNFNDLGVEDVLENVTHNYVLNDMTITNNSSFEEVKENCKDNIKLENTDDLIHFTEGKESVYVTYFVGDNLIQINDNGEEQGTVELSSEDILENLAFTSKLKMELYDGKVVEKSFENGVPSEDVDNSVVIKEITDKQIYKAELNLGQDITYISKLQTNINLVDIIDEIEIENFNLNGISTKTILVKKLDLEKYFGISGKVSFEFYNNSNLVLEKEISLKTEDENGYITLEIEQDVNSFKVKTTKPVNFGTFNIGVVKKVDSNYVEQAIPSITCGKYLVGEVENEISENVNNIELKDNISKAKLDVSTDCLSALEDNLNVEFKVTLLSNNEENALFKDPKILIELPKQVKEIDIETIDKIYADNLEVEDFKVIEEESKIILIQLRGTNSYLNSELIEGSTFSIKANVKVSEKAVTRAEKITMLYLNNAKNVVYENTDIGVYEKEINFKNTDGLITNLNIDNLEIKTNQNNKSYEYTLEQQSDEIKTSVHNVVVNNKKDLQNVVIVGSLNVGSIDLKVKQLSEVSSNGNLLEVYYTENEEATNDVEDVENGYSMEFNENAKKYLIKVGVLKFGDVLDYTYDITIPSNLSYGMDSFVKYDIFYSTEEFEEQVSSSKIDLTTCVGPVLETEFSAKIGEQVLTNDNKLSPGQEITYTTVVRNTGDRVASNVDITTLLPNDLTLSENSQNDVKSVESVNPNEKLTVSVTATVNEDVESNENIVVTSNVSYQNTSIASSSVENEVVAQDISMEVTYYTIPTCDNDISPYWLAGCSYKLECIIHNDTDTVLENAKLTWNLPEKFDITAKCYKFKVTHDSEDDYPEEERFSDWTETTIPIRAIQPGDYDTVVIAISVSDEIKEDFDALLSAKLEIEDSEVVVFSNVYTKPIRVKCNHKVIFEATRQEEILKPLDEFEYKFTLRNDNLLDLVYVLTDDLPEEISLVSVESEKLNISDQNVNGFMGNVSLDYGESVEILIKVKVDEKMAEKDTDIEIENYIRILTGIEEHSTEKLKHKIFFPKTVEEQSPLDDQPVVFEDLELDEQEEVSVNIGAIVEDPDIIVNSQENLVAQTEIIENVIEENTETEEDEQPTVSKGSIEGLVFEDLDNNGLYEGNDRLMNNITVMLCNLESGTIIKTTKTDSEGKYSFENVPNGRYAIVFDYDNSKYTTTKYSSNIATSNTSKALSVELAIEGQKKTYAMTDEIVISNSKFLDINLGLVKSQNFNLKLDKVISKVTVSTNKGIKQYDYSDVKLTKIEIANDEIQNCVIAIEYKILVTNVGDVVGTVGEITDYLSSDLSFISENNKDWKLEDNVLKTSVFSEEQINPGETKTVTLVLTKCLTKNSFGRFSNSAEITACSNDLGIADINSTPGNKKQAEDDYSTADVIIGIKSGEFQQTIYVTLLLLIFTIVSTQMVNKNTIHTLVKKAKVEVKYYIIKLKHFNFETKAVNKSKHEEREHEKSKHNIDKKNENKQKKKSEKLDKNKGKEKKDEQ